MSLSKLIVTRILKDGEVTLTQLETRATERGVSLDELYNALQEVHRNKAIARTVRGGEVVYTKAVKRTPLDHHTWLRTNYPPMDSTNDGSGIEADLSYLFLTPEELEKYRAEIRGVQYIPSKRYGKKGVRHTT
jgi:hypothetical protein